MATSPVTMYDIPGTAQRGWGATPAQLMAIDRFSPQQRQLMDQVSQAGATTLQQPIMSRMSEHLRQFGLDPQRMTRRSDFGPIRQEAQRAFQQETLPSMMHQMAGLQEGITGGSGFGRAIGRAMTNLQSQLAAQEAQHGLQERGLDQQLLGQLGGLETQERFGAMNMLRTGLQPQFEPSLIPRQPGRGEQLAGVGLQSLPFLTEMLRTYRESGKGQRALDSIAQGKPAEEAAEEVASESPSTAQTIMNMAKKYGPEALKTALFLIRLYSGV